jgi:hypothetical protein
MLVEGNDAMERMLLEMEMVCKQNSELLLLCKRKGIDVPRSLRSVEVHRLARTVRSELKSTGVVLSGANTPVSAAAPQDADEALDETNDARRPLPAHRYAREDQEDGGYTIE